MSGSAEQIHYVISQRVLPPLWSVPSLSFATNHGLFYSSHLLQQQDAQLLQVCLDALHNILKQTPADKLGAVTGEIEECGGEQGLAFRTDSRTQRSLGLDKIEGLQEHANRDIYQQSYEIVEKFFSNDTVSR